MLFGSKQDNCRDQADDDTPSMGIVCRNLLLELGAGQRVGLTGDAFADHSSTAHSADCRSPDQEDIIARTFGDLTWCGMPRGDRRLRSYLPESTAQAAVFEVNMELASVRPLLKTSAVLARGSLDERESRLGTARPGLGARSKTLGSLAAICLLLAAATCANATASFARWSEYSGYWVVGNRATENCEIVTANPTIDGSTIWFGSGPYKSLDDARLARSNIRGCPKDEPVN